MPLKDPVLKRQYNNEWMKKKRKSEKGSEVRKYHREYLKKWRIENPEKEKEFQKKSNAKRDYQKWYQNKKKNDPEFIKKRKAYYEENKEYFKQKADDWYKRNKERVALKARTLRQEVLEHYGMKCACCGETQFEFLALDHVNNDGNTHRREIGNSKIYKWAKENNYPDNLQILCHNCNLAKAFYGICPHQKEK